MAMSILGMAAAGVLLPFVSAASVQQEATTRVLAAKLAADRMEEIVYQGYEYACEKLGTEELVTEIELAEELQKVNGDDDIVEYFTDPVYKRFSRNVAYTAYPGIKKVVLITITVKYDINKTPADTTDDLEMIKVRSLIGS